MFLFLSPNSAPSLMIKCTEYLIFCSLLLIFWTSDSLFTEPPEDVHLVADPSVGTKKSKKKKKLPTDEVVNAEPSSLHNVGKEDSKENVDTVYKQDVHHATLSGTVEVPQEQKHPEPAEELVEWYKLPSSSMGTSICKYLCIVGKFNLLHLLESTLTIIL